MENCEKRGVVVHGRRQAVLWVFSCVCCCGLSLSGCSDGRPQLVRVSGQVLIDGQPLTTGAVQFVPTGARQSVGRLDSEGRFTLTCYESGDGAVVGTHRVAVRANQMINERTVRWHAPKKYASHKTSGIVEEITEPTDSLVIDLTWDGGHPFTEQD